MKAYVLGSCEGPVQKRLRRDQADHHGRKKISNGNEACGRGEFKGRVNIAVPRYSVGGQRVMVRTVAKWWKEERK